MTEARTGESSRRPMRHERPVIDEAGLDAARHADRLLAAARALGSERWIAYLEPLPDHLRDDEPTALRATATRCRAAYGVRVPTRAPVPAEFTEPFLDSIDRLIRELNRESHRSRG